MYDINVTYIHAHIPKTGGTSFNSTFAEQFDNGSRYSYHDKNILRFHQIPFLMRKRFKCVFGHVDLTFHNNLPSHPIYIFILRSPVKRIYSIYNYIKNNGNHPMHSKVKMLTFDDFIKSSIDSADIYENIYNVQSRVIAGSLGIVNLNSRDIISLAVANILNHDVRYGVISNYKSFLESLNKEFGWRLKEYRKNISRKNYKNKNINSEEEIYDLLSREARNILEKCTDADQYIYKFISDRL